MPPSSTTTPRSPATGSRRSTASLNTVKKQASQTNEQDVQLRALEREAKTERDLLESYLAKYREATARDNINAAPPEARIISRASPSIKPDYPKKLPTVLIAAFAAFCIVGRLHRDRRAAGSAVRRPMVRVCAGSRQPRRRPLQRCRGGVAALDADRAAFHHGGRAFGGELGGADRTGSTASRR